MILNWNMCSTTTIKGSVSYNRDNKENTENIERGTDEKNQTQEIFKL